MVRKELILRLCGAILRKDIIQCATHSFSFFFFFTRLQWAGKSFPDAIFTSYDMITPGDSFGKMMTKNLKVRGQTYHLL